MSVELKDYYQKIINIGKGNERNFDELCSAYLKLIKEYPKQKEAYYYLILLAAKNRKFNISNKVIKKYIKNNDQNSEIFYLQGRVLDEQMLYEQSIKAYGKSIALDSTNRKARFNRALAQLSLGQFDEGALGYSFRDFEKKHEKFLLLEKWDGFSSGENVLIWAEQGLGDEIMFYRLLPHIEKIENNYTLLCDKRLMSLIRENFPKINVISSAQDLAKVQIDKQIPCGDLFVYFYPELNKNTLKQHYLRPVARPDIRALIPATHKKYIGISWLSMNEERGAARSISAEKIASILDPEKHIIVNLQYLAPKIELEKFKSKQFQVIDQIDAFHDIEGLAQAIALCNAVITTDNTTLHLAGTMGTKTLGLIPFEPNWRWMQAAEATIWYESVKLIRQVLAEDWSEPLRRLKKELLLF